MNKHYRLADGLDFNQVHEAHMKHMTGTDYVKGSNADKIFRYLDQAYFGVMKNLEENERALSIDEARGNELDDLFGDRLGIPRNGRSDNVYRFVLKAHQMINNSDGTLPKLLQISASLLGCSPNDIKLVNSRHRLRNGRWTGKPDMILLQDVNLKNVNNPAMIPLLVKALQQSVGAGKHIHETQFYENHVANVPIAANASLGAKLTLKFPPNIQEKIHANGSINVARNVKDTAKLTDKNDK